MTAPMSCITKQTNTRSFVYGLSKSTRRARRRCSHWQDSMGFHSSECKHTSEYFFDDTLLAGKAEFRPHHGCAIRLFAYSHVNYCPWIRFHGCRVYDLSWASTATKRCQVSSLSQIVKALVVKRLLRFMAAVSRRRRIVACFWAKPSVINPLTPKRKRSKGAAVNS